MGGSSTWPSWPPGGEDDVLVQCKLGQDNRYQVGWIDQDAAKVGTKLKSGWTVLEVWGSELRRRLHQLTKVRGKLP